MFTSIIFPLVFEAIENEVEFDSKWSNGTGYFDNAKFMDLLPGAMVKSIDPNGRKIILMGSPLLTIVFFERYSDRKDIIVSNAHVAIEQAFDMTSNLTEEQLAVFFNVDSGTPEVNEQTIQRAKNSMAFTNLGRKLEGLKLAMA